MNLSIVIPVFRGEKTIASLAEQLIKELHDFELEIILVNDGSPDSSHEVCLGIFTRHKGLVKYLHLAKNFGEHNAVMAGLNRVTGEYAVIIDDDFQNPPTEIRKLIQKAVAGNYDVVYSYYEQKFHSYFRNLGSKFNDLVASCLLDKPRDLYLSSFKCLSRFTVKEITRYKGPYPYLDGLILKTTRSIGKVLVEHQLRKDGRSGYTLKKLARLWLNMFINFSVLPLRISTVLGFIFSIFGGASAVLLIVDKLNHPEIPVGITSILVAILVFSGIQLIMLGLIGEYIGQQYLTSNQTPQYVIREAYEK